MELYVAPMDFFVFGFMVIGGAYGLPLISLMEELAVAASAAFICCVKNLLVLGLPEFVYACIIILEGVCGFRDGIDFLISSSVSGGSSRAPVCI